MSRRTKEELQKAKERRLKQAASLLKKQGNKAAGTEAESRSKSSSQKQDVDQLFADKIGYSLDLVRKDLVKTTVVTVVVSLILVGLAVLT